MIILTDPEELLSPTTASIIELAQLFQLNGMKNIMHFAGQALAYEDLKRFYNAKYSEAFPFVDEIYINHPVLTSATYLTTLPKAWFNNMRHIVALVDEQTNLDFEFSENVTLIGEIDHEKVIFTEIGFETRLWKRDNISKENAWYVKFHDIDKHEHLIDRIVSWALAFEEEIRFEAEQSDEDNIVEVSPATRFAGLINFPQPMRSRTPFEFWFYNKPVIFFEKDPMFTNWFGDFSDIIPLMTPFVYQRELFPQWNVPKEIFDILCF